MRKIYHQVDTKHVGSPLEQFLEMAETINSKTADGQISRRGINIALLHKILKSLGGSALSFLNAKMLTMKMYVIFFVPSTVLLIFE